MAAATEQLEPTILVIFGITGDLSQRYLLPALYRLISQGFIDQKTAVIGVTRGDTSVEQLFEKMENNLAEADDFDVQALNSLKAQTEMFRMDLDQAGDYARLLEKLNTIEDQRSVCMNRLYYLSIPPKAYESVIELIGQAGLNTSCQHNQAVTRLLVEKPFGFDLNSAKQLINTTTKVFKEQQIFRIDHYMAKETVQNMLTFRFQNPIFGSLWSNKYIDRVEISAREHLGIEGRAAFYEPLGALRDIIQSHLLQILGIIAMDRPEKLDSDQIHARKQAVLEQVLPVSDVAKNAQRGQYRGYRQEVNNPASNTETFAAINLRIDNDRWRDVPFRLVTGKALDERKTEIFVNFYGKERQTSNQLHIRIQPNEGIELDLRTKRPGYTYDMQTTPMDFSYRDDFGENSQPNAYERVLVDAIKGSRTLFATSQEVLASWRIVQPVIEAWSSSDEGLTIYEPGAHDMAAGC